MATAPSTLFENVGDTWVSRVPPPIPSDDTVLVMLYTEIRAGAVRVYPYGLQGDSCVWHGVKSLEKLMDLTLACKAKATPPIGLILTYLDIGTALCIPYAVQTLQEHFGSTTNHQEYFGIEAIEEFASFVTRTKSSTGEKPIQSESLKVLAVFVMMESECSIGKVRLYPWGREGDYGYIDRWQVELIMAG